MAGCCTGKEIDLKDIGRTPGQKTMGDILGPLLTAGLSSGATPYGEQLSQAPDPAQMAAMNTMMSIGGYGGYQQNQYPLGMGPNLGPGVQAGPVNQMSIINAAPGNPYPNTQPGPPDSSPTSTVTSTVNSTTIPSVPSANPATVMATTYDNPVLPGPGVRGLPIPMPIPGTDARASGPIGKRAFFDPYQAR